MTTRSSQSAMHRSTASNAIFEQYGIAPPRALSRSLRGGGGVAGGPRSPSLLDRFAAEQDAAGSPGRPSVERAALRVEAAAAAKSGARSLDALIKERPSKIKVFQCGKDPLLIGHGGGGTDDHAGFQFTKTPELNLRRPAMVPWTAVTAPITGARTPQDETKADPLQSIAALLGRPQPTPGSTLSSKDKPARDVLDRPQPSPSSTQSSADNLARDKTYLGVGVVGADRRSAHLPKVTAPFDSCCHLAEGVGGSGGGGSLMVCMWVGCRGCLCSDVGVVWW